MGAQAGPDRGHPRLPGRVGSLRVLDHDGEPDPVPRAAGHRRGRRAGHREHAGRRLVRPVRTGPGAGLAVQRVGHLRGDRPGAGREPGPVRVLALDLPDQPADRRGHDRPAAALPARERPADPAPDRRGRRGRHVRRRGRAHLRPVAGRRGLGLVVGPQRPGVRRGPGRGGARG